MARKKQIGGLGRILMDRKIVEAFRSGSSTSKIAKDLDKSKGYVIKLRGLAIEYGYIEKISDDPLLFRRTSRELPPFPEAVFTITDNRQSRLADTDDILDPHKAWIKERLSAGWSPQTIFEELPVGVPRSNFYRYLGRHELRLAPEMRHSPEIISAPGDCLQIDWGKVFDVTENGKSKIIWGFIGVLGHSRRTLVRVVDRCDFETTVNAITSMLTELGGVPRRITSDNPKVFVVGASNYEPSLNLGYERFASHYGFTIEALPPADPQKKGKVERNVPPVRRIFESYDKSGFTLESAQAHADRRVELLNLRRHGSHQMKPYDVFLRDEKPILKPLPQVPYEVEKILSATIRVDGYVRFLNKYYRVDPKLKRETALVIGNTDFVSIYCAGRLLEVYDRIKDPFQMRACKDHYKELWEKTLNDHGHYIKMAERIGPNVSRFVQIVLARGEGFVDNRVVWGLFSLSKTYELIDVDKACASALELSSVNLQTVRSLVKIHSKPKDKEAKTKQEGKFTRPMAEYKAQLRLVFSAT